MSQVCGLAPQGSAPWTPRVDRLYVPTLCLPLRDARERRGSSDDLVARHHAVLSLKHRASLACRSRMRVERSDVQAVHTRGPGRGALGSKSADLRHLKKLLTESAFLFRNVQVGDGAFEGFGGEADGFGQGGMGVDGEADVSCVGAHLDGQSGFGDQVAG